MMDKIQINFEKFHVANPHVFAWWEHFTDLMIEAGFGHGSASLVAERIRWETSVVTTSFPPVKLNNNYRSRYARLWMQKNPEYKDFFRTRELAVTSVDSVANLYGFLVPGSGKTGALASLTDDPLPATSCRS